ncbi:unnamed protein product [Prorocentrum cordatum]|uniref:Uncharacterized protein n=1 Tax=Prorocentrum cordatum TaxID=2364126 RepID=A0ABN9T8M3_9DINO|nr:unnamed protein product [Polarella glacialis]
MVASSLFCCLSLSLSLFASLSLSLHPFSPATWFLASSLRRKFDATHGSLLCFAVGLLRWTREQNVSYFRESGHFQHAIKKLLSRCSDYMPEKHYRQLEQSLQLDVRFFSEHNVVDADFSVDSPRFHRGGDEEAMAELKEKNGSLEEENEALQKQVEELEASLRQARDENVAMKRRHPPMHGRRPTPPRRGGPLPDRPRAAPAG